MGLRNNQCPAELPSEKLKISNRNVCVESELLNGSEILRENTMKLDFTHRDHYRGLRGQLMAYAHTLA